MPRTKFPEPTREEIRQRFLDLLREAGTMKRHKLRERIHYRLRAAIFDEVAAELVAAGLVEVETVQETHQALRGYPIRHMVTWCRITERGREIGGE